MASLAVVGRRSKGFPGRHCLPPKTWANYLPLYGAAPEKEDPSRKAEDKKMFQGKTIEELINSVVRAEDHAREQEKIQALALERQYPLRRFEWRQEMVEVA
ncbi:MAG TPA: hypothetical protein VH724_05680 [Candidatus Angelobacter sp.]|nr:hypothetical protein [Candidatus Angelobacter sp.]